MPTLFELFGRDELAECGTSSTNSTPSSMNRVEASVPSDSQSEGFEEKITPQAPTPLKLPEGGLHGWLSVVGGAMVTFSTFGMIQSFGVFQDYYTRVRFPNHSPSTISWIGSIQAFLIFALGLPAGKLFDKGYFRLCTISGTVLLVISSFMLSLTKPSQFYAIFLSQGIGMGIGMGLLFLPSMTLTSHYFRARRSVAMGVVLTGSSLGAVIHPIILNNMLQRENGFAQGIRATSYLDLGLLVLANILMRPRPFAHRSVKRQPISLVKIFRDADYVLFAIGTALLFWGTFIPFFYLQLYAAVNNVPKTVVTYSVAIMNVSSIFGRSLPNFIADYVGPFNVLVPSAIASSGLIFGLLGASSTAGVLVFAIVYGFISGGFLSMATPTAASFSTNSDLSDVGLRVGFVSFGIAFAVLTGNPIAGGLLHSPHYHWWRPLTFGTIVSFGGSALLFWARLGVAKRKGKSWV